MKYALCTMHKILNFLKKEAMLTVSVLAALVALIITPPSADLLQKIDWRTLGTLFMMLTVLEGFKKENVFEPLIKFSTHFRTMKSLVLFLVFGVFFTSMFVTNDVSLIIFVPLTITLMKQTGKEHYILPVISLENIAAVRGSMLMPFGSPQNLFLYGRFGVSTPVFILHMLPLCAFSALLLVIFIFVLLRHENEELLFDVEKSIDNDLTDVNEMRRKAYPVLFVLVLSVIVTRTALWPYAVMIIALSVLLMDKNVLLKTDYVLLATFLCFFVFSSSITSNEKISLLLEDLVANNEYWWAIGISQIISNVPASIVLWPFTVNNAALIYGLDTAGLCSLIGSLASVINYRIYVRVYPGKGRDFIKTFTLISWAFLAIVIIPGYLLSSWNFA